MTTFVVRATNYAMLNELANALRAERVATWKGNRLFFVMIIRLKANTALKDGFHFYLLFLTDFVVYELVRPLII